ncbi:MAG: GNAT family N-acetyltransferase [Cellvibrionaceae bacterium]|nr:GNAT family N-acetyltransferase [Cellvibrionaceae bacterium]|tara:strand:- start:30687 stop:30935 length:249 start_codon:yes stop_codon:yes gene_type:complete
MNTLNVEHHRDLNCFVLGSEGQFAKLEYSRQGDGVTFTSTYVPFRLRGQGVAEALVERGLSWAKDNNLNVSSTCWYVDKFLV